MTIFNIMRQSLLVSLLEKLCVHLDVICRDTYKECLEVFSYEP